MATYGTDTFTDTAATALASHTPELGGPWATHPVSDATMVISDANRARLSAASGTARYLLNGAVPASADYEVNATLHYFTNSGSVFAIAGRYNATADTCYCLRRLVSAGQWQLAKIVGGTVTALGSPVTVALSAGTDYDLTLRMVGNQISAVVDGVEIIGPVADSSITAAGRAGFRSSASGGSTGNTVGMHFDDFVVRDAVPTNLTAPVISTDGTPQTGETVTCSTGTWTGLPSGYLYQWTRGGVDIAGATSSTYALQVADEDAEIVCEVTATNSAGSTTANSNTIVPQPPTPLTADDIAFVYSGGAGNSSPLASIGGAEGDEIATPAPSQAIFDRILGSVAAIGQTDYRLVYVRNDHSLRSADLVAYVAQQITNDDPDKINLSIGAPVEGPGQVVAAPADRFTAPAGVTFSAPTDWETGIALGELAPGESVGLWIRRTVLADAPLNVFNPGQIGLLITELP